MEMNIIKVNAANPYQIFVGKNLEETVLTEVKKYSPYKVAIFYQQGLTETAEKLRINLQEVVAEAHRIEVPAGEKGKDLEVAAFGWEVLGKIGIARDDLIVSLGGGAACDIAGFIASTWMRGIKIIHLPTTLLSMVDAAIGGKTALNTTAGKNLVGTFYEPKAVIADINTLKTLPSEELRSEMAEIVKCGFIADPSILEIIENLDEIDFANFDENVLLTLIEKAIRVKADIVSTDLKENSAREKLNYGHTFGHAVERLERYNWRHGDAVALGMIFAAELSKAYGKLDEAKVDKHYRILEKVGLPTEYKPNNFKQLSDYMRSDKKTRQGMLRFIVLEDIGKPVVLTAPDSAILQTVYEEICN